MNENCLNKSTYDLTAKLQAAKTISKAQTIQENLSVELHTFGSDAEPVARLNINSKPT